MAFDVREYISGIAAELENLPLNKREFFSLWCCQPLLKEFGEFLWERIGSAAAASLNDSIDTLWKHVLDGVVLSPSVLQDMGRLLESTTWSEEEVLEGKEFENFGAVELVGCLQRVVDVFTTGSSRSAAETAERIINRIDYELTMIDGVDAPEQDLRFENEIERQQMMLDHLKQTPQISHADLDRFRA